MGAVSGDVTPNSSSPISAWNRKAVPPNLTSTSICKKIKRKKLRECERKKNPKTICCKFAQSVANCKKSPGSHFFSKVHNIWEQQDCLLWTCPIIKSKILQFSVITLMQMKISARLTLWLHDLIESYLFSRWLSRKHHPVSVWLLQGCWCGDSSWWSLMKEASI